MSDGLAGVEGGLRFPACDPAGAAQALRRHGLVIIDGFSPPSRIEGYATALASACPELLDERQADLDQTHVVGDLRQISPIVFGGPLACPDLLLHAQLELLLETSLGSDFVFESGGVIVSHPGASQQHRHADGSALFGLPQLDRMLPAFAITVVIPLAPMDEQLGTTGFWPGSHLVAGDEGLSEADMIAPVVPVGSAILWDYRVRHCGLANRGDRPRPLLYVTACRPFWIDSGNFVRGRDRKLLVDPEAFDALDARGRARFARAEIVAPGMRAWT